MIVPWDLGYFQSHELKRSEGVPWADNWFSSLALGYLIAYQKDFLFSTLLHSLAPL
jgi:hypothetical protein